jgi:hypothetical protein
MRKKYLVKHPSSKAYLHLDYSSLLTHSQQPELKSRGTHAHPKRPLGTRFKTEPGEPLERHSLKRRESSVGSLKKGRKYLPANKENLRLEKKPFGNRLTYNENRAS